MPIFLGNHANSAVVLHYAWHCQGHSSTIRTLIMHSMAEWYMRGEQHDQIRLSRILDVAQDLKVWIYMKKSKFLNYRNFFFKFSLQNFIWIQMFLIILFFYTGIINVAECYPICLCDWPGLFGIQKGISKARQVAIWQNKRTWSKLKPVSNLKYKHLYQEVS